MKQLILFLAVILFFHSESLSQIKFEISGGYINSLNSENLFTHTKDGIQGSLTLLYPLTELTQLTGKVIYQSRRFNPKSFSFYIPLVVGYPMPVVTNGDNLKSFGLLIGARVNSNRHHFINPYVKAETGLIYHSDSYYELNNATRMKYSGSKTLFEYSFGIGLNIKLSNGYSFNIDGNLSHIPAEGLVYFPINLGFQLPL